MDANMIFSIVLVGAVGFITMVVAYILNKSNKVSKDHTLLNHTVILFKSGASITYNHTEFNVQISDEGRVIYLKIKQSDCDEVDPIFMDYDEIIAIQETTPKPYSPQPFIG